MLWKVTERRWQSEKGSHKGREVPLLEGGASLKSRRLEKPWNVYESQRKRKASVVTVWREGNRDQYELRSGS